MARVIEAHFEGTNRGFSRVISREPYAEVIPYEIGRDSQPQPRKALDPRLHVETRDYQYDGSMRHVVTTYTQPGQDIPNHQELLALALNALPAERERLGVQEGTRVNAIRVRL